MKGLIKILSAGALVFALLGLASCGKDKDAPDGMQLVRGGEEYGYNFYVPEEWVVASYGDIACAYVSAVNATSVSFAEAEMPPEGMDDDGMSAADAKAYFVGHMDNLAYMKGVAERLSVDAEPCKFGNSPDAYKFVYTYDYTKEDGSVLHYRAMQILIPRGDRLYIFQYNSQNATPNYSTDGMTYYDIYLEKVNEVIASFRFLGTPPPIKNSTASSEGDFVLVSDKKLCGFNFYAPSGSSEIASSALVHRDLGGGSSVSISSLVSNTQTTHPDDYFNGIKSNMEKSYGEVIKLTDTDGDKKDTNKLNLNGVRMAYYYEYEYTYASVTYQGYMVIIQTGTNAFNAEAYLFNYTGIKGSSYNKELCDAMLAKLEF